MNDEDEQSEAWETLYEKVREVLRQYGEENYLGEAQFWVLSDNYGFRTINVALHSLSMLQPVIVRSLQALLGQFPEWAIIVAIDVPGTEGTWPRMQLLIRSHEIVDQLQRRYLPDEFRTLKF